MKKSFVLITIIALLFSLIGCSTDNAPLTGSIRVSVNDSASRTITSDVSPKAVKYTVVGTAPDGSTVSFELNESTPSWTNAEAAPGNWSFTATAYNDDGKAIGDGSSSATVVPGQSTSAIIEVNEYSGMGNITVNLTGITTDRVRYTAAIFKMMDGNMTEVESGEFDAAGIVSFTLPNGFYALILSCDNASINMPAAEAVRIMKDDNLSVSYSICDQGGVEAVISNGIKPCPEMSITLNSENVVVGSAVTATATITPGNYRYSWYVDGERLNTANGNSADITFAWGGRHKVTCVAYDTRTAVVWSDEIDIDVSEQQINTVSFYSGNRLIETRNYTPDSSEEFPTLELGEGFTLSGWKAEDSDELITDESFSLPYSEEEYKYYAYIDTELLRIDDTGAVYGTDALKNSSITSLVIPYSIAAITVRAIGDYAFQFYSALTQVVIPDSVISIGDYSFWRCSGLTKVTIPDSVTSIGTDAFIECSGLTEVTIGNSVTSIGDGAFSVCKNLKEIYIPDSVISIGDNVFYHCYSLTDITIPDSVRSIGDGAFQSCYGLSKVTIPDSVISIGACAFYHCSGLTDVTIGNSVISMGYSAFDSCSSLKKINIPDSLTCIGDNPFLDCYELEEIIVSENNASYKSIEGVLFSKDSKKVYCFPAGKTNTVYTIPDSVTSIEDRAFSYCTSLPSITIPESVTRIGTDAFKGCTSLPSITIPDSVTSIGDDAFYDCSSLSEIRINQPKDSVSGAPWGGNETVEGTKAVTVIWSDETVVY